MAPPEFRAVLGRLRLFAGLEQDTLAELARGARMRRGRQGSIIVHRGDTDGDFFGLVRGHMGVFTTTQDGREVMLNLLQPGDGFGELSLLDEKPRSATVIALDDFELVVIGRQQFLHAIRTRPDIAFRLLQSLAERVRHLSDRAEDRVSLSLRERLAKRLLALGDTTGTRIGPNEIALNLSISQRTLGDMVDSSRESVNRCLRAWAQAGILRRAGRQWIITDRDGLEALSQAADRRE
jgi:CRP/FNR family transcriptional regulator, cyclic AMP receptor protein